VPLPHFTPEGNVSVFRNLNVNKANAPDDIPLFILKNCSQQIVESLSQIFNASIQKSKMPSKWKNVIVVQILKNGDKCVIQNYRPISLLSCSSKVLERCIVNKLYPRISTKLHELQHGFVKSKSCTTQLLQTYNSFDRILDDRGGQVDVLFLDFGKALIVCLMKNCCTKCTLILIFLDCF
jgi:hypothetical protein